MAMFVWILPHLCEGCLLFVVDSPSAACFLLHFQVFFTTYYVHMMSLLSMYATCKDLILLTANFVSL